MQDAKLKALKAKWEKILEKDGLGDIEKRGYLRVYHDSKLHSADSPWFNPIKNDAKEAYYQLAGAFLHEHHFESDKERKIWELHSQGIPVREIAKQTHQPRNWSRVARRIARLRKLMLHRTSLP